MFKPLKTKLDDLRIILATASKQRHNILLNTGLNCESMSSEFSENLDVNAYTFVEYVEETAKCKAEAVYRMTKGDERVPDIIIGMDTMVCYGGKLYGKPKNKEDAIATITKLTSSGIPHTVHTGVAIKYKDCYDTFTEETKVYMHPLTNEEVFGYIETGEYIGKAGSYAIQGIGGSFVEKIEGDYNNVVGVPLCALTFRLKKLLA